MKRKKMSITIIFALLIIVGVTFVVIHQQQVKAERIAQEKRETEKRFLKTTTAAVDTAYQTRADKDIQTAETAVSKLSSHQKAEKSQLTQKLTQLKSYLKQISDVNTALAKATQSKTEEDIKATQALIDKETSNYLKADKTEAQNKLSALIAQITKEKAEMEAKTKAEGQAKQQASEVAQQASNTLQTPSVETYSQAPQQPYQAPEQHGSTQTYQAPAQPAGGNSYTPPAPTQPSNTAPTKPATGGGISNGTGGVVIDPGNPTGSEGEMGPWMP